MKEWMIIACWVIVVVLAIVVPSYCRHKPDPLPHGYRIESKGGVEFRAVSSDGWISTDHPKRQYAINDAFSHSAKTAQWVVIQGGTNNVGVEK